MRLSELHSREIINLHDGARVGLVGETEILFDPETGEIQELLLPARGGIWQRRRSLAIPWEAVRRIGPEVMIVEVQSPKMKD